ncbi:MAG: GAF domain-containing protein [Desulfobacter sp.]|nr:MAG: GAF domain-containing protein [Desulfobacter sp.]
MAKGQSYFDIICELHKAFNSARTQNELLKLVVDTAVDVMDGKAACLFLKSPGSEFFIHKAQTGLSGDYLHANPMKTNEIVGALEEKGFLYFEDATTDPHLENHEAKKAEGIASILTVPVRVADETRGVLSLYTAVQRKFTKRQIDFLCVLADQSGLAIRMNALINRLRKNSMLFLELASDINSSLDIKVIMENLTKHICETFEMKGVDIRLLDEDTDTLTLMASHGLSDEFIERKRTINTETTTRALKGETVIVGDTDTDDRITFKKEIHKEGIKSMIVTPVMAREKIIGVMRFYSAEFTRFPSDVLVMMEALAHQGGLAIQNASMYLALKEEKANLEEDIWSHRAWF